MSGNPGDDARPYQEREVADATTRVSKMKASDQYLKIVRWSDEDGCYVGTCPGLCHGGVHGDDEAAVYAELCQVVEEWIDILDTDGKSLPPATATAAQIRRLELTLAGA